MPPGTGYGDGTTGLLEGLVGGFLMGHDFRTQREDRKVSAAERVRRQQIEDEERRVAAATRARTEAIQDVNLRAEHGLAYDPTTPSGAAATPLTRAVQTAYNVPEGFRRVGPSAAERRAAELASLRRGAGQFLMASPEERATMFGDPNVVAGLGELGFDIDNYIESTTPKSVPRRTGVVQSGGRSVLVDMDTGDPIREYDAAPGADGAGGGTAQERLNARLGSVATSANEELAELDHLMTGIPESALLGGRGTTGVISGLRNWSYAKAAGEEGQRAVTAALNFVNPVVRYLSGAQMNEQEAGRYLRALVPQPGESAGAIEMKRRMRQILIDAMGQGQLAAPESEKPDFALIDAAMAEVRRAAQAGAGAHSGGIFDDLVP